MGRVEPTHRVLAEIEHLAVSQGARGPVRQVANRHHGRHAPTDRYGLRGRREPIVERPSLVGFCMGKGDIAKLLYWQDRFAEVSDRVIEVTRDGTAGHKGHISRLGEILTLEKIKPDLIIVNGCTFLMMKVSEVTEPLGIKTIVNMNPIMIDGTGMCGVCRLTVSGKMKFACVDGPDFDGHEIDWEEFLKRRQTYNPEEVHPLRKSGCASHF